MSEAIRLRKVESGSLPALRRASLFQVPSHDAARLTSDQTLGALLWAAFSEQSTLDREIWAHCVWSGHCVCRLVQSTGLSIEQIKTRLQAIACQMDRVLEMLQAQGTGPVQRPPADLVASGPGDAARVKKAIPVGASARRLSTCLRAGKLRCRCDLTVSG